MHGVHQNEDITRLPETNNVKAAVPESFFPVFEKPVLLPENGLLQSDPLLQPSIAILSTVLQCSRTNFSPFHRCQS